MSKEVINIGTVANDGTGDRIRVAFTKTNNNFTELYNAVTNTAQINSIDAAFLKANTPSHVANSASIYANGAFAVANSSSIYANGAFGIANSASALAQAAFNYANTIVSDTQIDPYSRNHANASFNVANSAAAYSNTVDATQNTNISYIWNYANAAFSYANTISGGSAIDNVARTTAETANIKGTSAEIYANGAFAAANNEAGVNATQNTNITIAQNTGDAAFIRANNSLNANTGGAISGNLLPTTTNTYYLGSDANRWHSLYVGPGSIDLGGLVLSNQNGTLAVSVGGQPPTQISGSDQVARDTANAAFAAANNISGSDQVARNTANAAFASANNIDGINATQNTNITTAQNTANAAFASANTKVSKSGDTMTGDLKFGGGGGILNLPTNQIAITANVDTDVSGFIAQATGVSTVYANTDVIIQANTGGTNSQWNFTKEGTITFPDSTIQTTAYVPGDEIDPYARNHANAAFASANNVAPQIEPAFNTANAAFAAANNEAGVNATQNTQITILQNTTQAAFNAANNVAPQIEPAFNTANAAFLKANNEAGVNATQNTNITNAQNTGDAAFLKANNEAGVNATQNTNITNAQNTGDAAFAKANNESGVNATQNTNITNAQNKADGAFIRANNSLNANNGGTITGDLSISGNLSVLGNTFTISATTLVANDTVILLGAGNYTSDLLDIGISAHYNDGVNAHTGLIRDHGTKEWQLFEGYTGEIGANNDIDINNASFKIATLNANLKSQTITLNGQNLQTYIDGSYNKANAAFNSANNIDGINTTQNNSITAAFAAANNEAGVNATQNTNITIAKNTADAAFLAANNAGGADQVARNTANAAFLTANTANNTANIAYRTNFISATRQRLVVFQEGGIYFRYRFPDIAGPTANSPTLNVIAGQTYAFDISAIEGSGFGGFKLYTASPFASGSALSGVTHVSSSGVVTSNATSGYTNGILYWTAPTSLVGNTTLGYGDTTYNSIFGSIRVQSPTDGGLAFSAANTASNTAIYRSLTPAATKFRIIEGASAANWQIDQYSGNYPTIYVISGQTYVFDFNFNQDRSGSSSYFRLLDDSSTEFTGNVAYVSSANTSSVTGASYSSTFKFIGSVYWKVPTSAEGKIYKYQNGADFSTGNIVIISHSALANAANSTGAFAVANSAAIYANGAFIAANSVSANATSAGIYANAAFNTANAAFITANAGSAIDSTQNTNITNAHNTANAAFTVANTVTVVNTEADYASAIRIRFTAAATDFYVPAIHGTSSANPPITLIAGIPYAFDVNDSTWNSTSLLGLRLRTNFNASGGSWLANVTHISPAGVITQNTTATNGYKTGTLYWTPPKSLVGNTTLVYDDGFYYNSRFATITIVDPDAISNTVRLSFNQANSAFIQANAAFNAANSAGGADTFARNTANAAFIHANSSFNHANSAFLAANGSIGTNDSQNTSIQFARNHANAAFNAANTAGGADTVARNTANAAFSFANSVFANVAVVAYNYVASQGSEVFGWGDLTGDGTYGGSYSGTGVGNADVRRSSPIQMNFGKGWVSFNETYETSMHGIKYDGTLWSWGRNTDGTIGDGTTAPRSSPTQIGTLGGWKQVSGTEGSTAAIKYDGSLWTWGYNLYGMLGTNDAISRSSPVQVGSSTNQTSFTWTDISVGAGTLGTMAGIKSDGTLWAWGSDNSGTLGISLVNIYRSSPTQIGANTFWQTVKVVRSGSGYGHVLALTRTRELWVWGSNYYGVLGINLPDGAGAFNARSSPVQVGTDNNWAQISGSARQGVSAAIKTNGTLWTWGFNEYGQLGQNFAQAGLQGRSSPAQIGARTDWSKVIGGTVAIRKDGTIWSWGRNDNASVGDNTTINRSSPVQLFATSNRSPGQWRTIAAVGTTPYSVTYAVRWSDQGVGSSAESLLIANNIVTGI